MNDAPLRIHLAAVDPLRLRAMVAALESHAAITLTGATNISPQLPGICARQRVRAAVILAGPVPVEVLNTVSTLRSLNRRVESVVLIEDPVDPERIRALLAAGARGVLSERAKPEEVHRAVRAVIAGGCVLGPAATQHVLERAGWAQQQFLGVPLESLDLEILSSLADGCSGSETAARLGVDEATVRSTIRAAKRAFSQRTQEGVVAAAIQRGLI